MAHFVEADIKKKPLIKIGKYVWYDLTPELKKSLEPMLKAFSKLPKPENAREVLDRAVDRLPGKWSVLGWYPGSNARGDQSLIVDPLVDLDNGRVFHLSLQIGGGVIPDAVLSYPSGWMPVEEYRAANKK